MIKSRIRQVALLLSSIVFFGQVNGLLVQQNQPCNKDRDILLAEDPNGNKQAFLRCVSVGVGSIGFWEKRFCPNDMAFDFVNQQCKVPIATQIVNLFNGATNALTGGPEQPDAIPQFAILNNSCAKGQQCIGGTVCDLETMKCLCPVGTVTNLETLSCIETSNFEANPSSNLPQAKIYPAPPQNGVTPNYFKGNSGNPGTQFNSFGNNNGFRNGQNAFGQASNGNYGALNSNKNSQNKPINGVFLPEPTPIEPVQTLVKPGGSCANGEQCGGGSLCTKHMKLCLCPGELEDHGGQCVRPLANTNTFSNFVFTTPSPSIQTVPQVIITQPPPSTPLGATKVERVGIGAYCNEFAECDYDSTCVHSRCTCVSPLVEYDGKCILRLTQLKVGPGELCDNGEICTRGSVCDPVIPVCVCPQGTDLDNGACISVSQTTNPYSSYQTTQRQTLPPTLIPRPSPQPQQPLPSGTYNNLGVPPTPFTRAPPQPIRTAPPPAPQQTKPNPLKIQLGGSKQAGVGMRCSLNTDCMIGAYCNGNTQPPTCQCLSTHVNVNGRCEKVIYPGQSGCEHDLQCTTAYAGTTCQNRECICPEGSKAIEQTCVSEFSHPGGPCDRERLPNSTVMVPLCLEGSVCKKKRCECPEPLVLVQGRCIHIGAHKNLVKIDIVLKKDPEKKKTNGRFSSTKRLSASEKESDGPKKENEVEKKIKLRDPVVKNKIIVKAKSINPETKKEAEKKTKSDVLEERKEITVKAKSNGLKPKKEAEKKTKLAGSETKKEITVKAKPDSPKKKREISGLEHSTKFNNTVVTPEMKVNDVEIFSENPRKKRSPECYPDQRLCADGKGICINQICQCLHNFVYHNGECLSEVLDLGSFCDPEALSPRCKNNSICVNGICVCEEKKTCEVSERKRSPESFKEKFSPKSYGESCISGDVCLNGTACINGICTCPGGFSFDQDSGCSKISGVFRQINSQCLESDRCSGGSVCINSICSCIDGSVETQGRCRQKPGGRCSQGQSCAGSSICRLGLCQCPPGKRLLNHHCIVSIAKAGESCQSGQQCINSSFCRFGICMCSADFRIVDGKCEKINGKQTFSQKPVPDTSFPKISSEENSQDSDSMNPQKSSSRTNMIESTTARAKVYVSTGKLIYSKPGQLCLDGEICQGNSTCKEGYCVCRDEEIIIDDKCISNDQDAMTVISKINKSAPGQYCREDSACTGNSVCLGNICVCPLGKELIQNECQETKPGGPPRYPDGPEVMPGLPKNNKSGPGQFCQEDSLCTGNSVCLGNTCICPQGTELVQNECRETKTLSMRSPGYSGDQGNVRVPGSLCQLTLECPYRTDCIRGVCRCKSGETVVGGTCRKAIYQVSPGGNCDPKRGLDCVGESQCYYGICVCLYGLINTGKGCESPEALHNVPPGGDCTELSHCIANSACINNICRCLDEYVVDVNQKCVLKSSTVPFYAYPVKYPKNDKIVLKNIPTNTDSGKIHQIVTANSMSINLVDQETLRALLLKELDKVPILNEACNGVCGNGARCMNGYCQCDTASGFSENNGKCVINSGNSNVHSGKAQDTYLHPIKTQENLMNPVKTQESSNFYSYPTPQGQMYPAANNNPQSNPQMTPEPEWKTLGQPGKPCAPAGICFNAAVCIQNFCVCKPGYAAKNGYCEISKVPLNSPCVLSEQCESGYCNNGICFCLKGSDSRGRSRCAPRDLARPGSNCLQNLVCGYNSFCGVLSGVCECPNGMETFTQAGECRAATKSRGSACFSSANCHKSTYCDNGYCICKNGFIMVNGFCLPSPIPLTPETIQKPVDPFKASFAGMGSFRGGYGREIGELAGKGAASGISIGGLIGKVVSGTKNQNIDNFEGDQKLVFVEEETKTQRPFSSGISEQNPKTQQGQQPWIQGHSMVNQATSNQQSSIPLPQVNKEQQIQQSWGQNQLPIRPIPSNQQSTVPFPQVAVLSSQTPNGQEYPQNTRTSNGQEYPQNARTPNGQEYPQNTRTPNGQEYPQNTQTPQNQLPISPVPMNTGGFLGRIPDGYTAIYKNFGVDQNQNPGNNQGFRENQGERNQHFYVVNPDPRTESRGQFQGGNWNSNVPSTTGQSYQNYGNQNQMQILGGNPDGSSNFNNQNLNAQNNQLPQQNVNSFVPRSDNFGSSFSNENNYGIPVPQTRKNIVDDIAGSVGPVGKAIGSMGSNTNSQFETISNPTFTVLPNFSPMFPNMMTSINPMYPSAVYPMNPQVLQIPQGYSMNFNPLVAAGARTFEITNSNSVNSGPTKKKEFTVSMPGEYCGDGATCMGNSVCNQNYCQCPGNTRIENGICGYNPAFLNSQSQNFLTSIRNQKIRRSQNSNNFAKPLEPCENNETCTRDSECKSIRKLGSICLCKQDTVFFVDACVSKEKFKVTKLGEYCDGSDLCENGSECLNGKCNCHSNFWEIEGICVRVSKPGETCGFGEHCVDGSICEETIKTCICPQGKKVRMGACIYEHPEKKKNYIPPRSLPGQMCDSFTTCIESSYCSATGTCECTGINNVIVNHRCVPSEKIRLPGESCGEDSICILKSKCSRIGICECLNGNAPKDKKCEYKLKISKLPSSCSENNECPKGTGCKGGNCYCGTTVVKPRKNMKICKEESDCEEGLSCSEEGLCECLLDSQSWNQGDFFVFGNDFQKKLKAKRSSEETFFAPGKGHEKADEKVRSPPGGSCSEKEECTGGSVCREGWCICPDPTMIVTRGLCVQTQPRPTLPPVTTTQTPYRPSPPASVLPSARKAAPGTSCGPLDQCVGGSSCVDSVCLCPAGTQPNTANGRCERLEAKAITQVPESTDWLTEELFPSSRQTPLPPRIPIRTTRPLTRLPLGIPSSGDEYFSRITNNQNRRIVTSPSSPSSIYPPSPSPSIYPSRILAELGGNQGQDETDNEVDEEDTNTSGDLDECAKTGLFCRGGTICINLTCQCPPSYILHNDQCVPPITPKKQVNKRKGKSSYRGPRYANPAESCSNGEICTGGAVCKGKQVDNAFGDISVIFSNNKVCPFTGNYSGETTCVCPPEKPILKASVCTAPEVSLVQKPKVAGPGQECSPDVQCTEGSVCNQGICRCQQGFIAISGKCVRLPSTPIPTQKTTKVSVIVGPEEACGNGKECGGGSSCQNGICKCPQGLILNEGKCQRPSTTRVPTSIVTLPAVPHRQSKLGTDLECTDDTQCGDHGICVVNKCKCRTGYRESDGVCILLEDVAFERAYSQNSKPRIVGPPIRRPKPKTKPVQTIPSGRSSGKGVCPPGNDPLLEDGAIRICNGMNPTCPPKSYCYVTGPASEEYNCCKSW